MKATVRRLKSANEAHVGQRVLYRAFPGGVAQPGVVASVNDHHVFVRFTEVEGGMACRPRDLIAECEPSDARREILP